MVVLRLMMIVDKKYSTITTTKYNKKDVSMSTNPWNHVAEVSEIKNTPDCETRVAEQDAFTAGWNAAIAFIVGIKED